MKFIRLERIIFFFLYRSSKLNEVFMVDRHDLEKKSFQQIQCHNINIVHYIQNIKEIIQDNFNKFTRYCRNGQNLLGYVIVTGSLNYAICTFTMLRREITQKKQNFNELI